MSNHAGHRQTCNAPMRATCAHVDSWVNVPRILAQFLRQRPADQWFAPPPPTCSTKRIASPYLTGSLNHFRYTKAIQP